MEPFSVLMSVYHKESHIFLDEALYSILKSTIMPQELILVEDGALTESLYGVIERYRADLNIISVKLDLNIGLALALNEGLRFCSNRLVARCDSDDINCADRFEKQLKSFKDKHDLSLIGGWVEEFNRKPGDLGSVKMVPAFPGLVRYSKRRNPFNHPAVMFDKNVILAIGGYFNISLFEDYELWMRLLSAEKPVDNMQCVLVAMRVGSGFYERRGGFKYAWTELKFFLKMHDKKIITILDVVFVVLFRIPARLLPTVLRRLVYFKLLR